MAGIDHAPPPFFKRGPAPLALLTFYIAVSLAIFVFDLRFKSLELLRQSIALVVDPVQRVAQTPGSLVDYASHYLQGMHSLQQENDELKHAKLTTAPDLQRLAHLEAENDRLRKLLAIKNIAACVYPAGSIPIFCLKTDAPWPARWSDTRAESKRAGQPYTNQYK